jgi:hypothetical protein
MGPQRKEESSFSAEKEAKRPLRLGPEVVETLWVQVGKVLWFFLSRKNNLLPLQRTNAGGSLHPAFDR